MPSSIAGGSKVAGRSIHTGLERGAAGRQGRFRGRPERADDSVDAVVAAAGGRAWLKCSCRSKGVPSKHSS